VVSGDWKEFKVVRYSGSKEIQSIQFDGQGHSLYLSENKNLDICMADSGAWRCSGGRPVRKIPI
jgi:hypothetical protein